MGYQVFDSHGEERRIQKQYENELQAATTAEKTAEREKKLAITLEEQAKEHQAALITLDKNLTVARKQVETLEGQKKIMVKEVAEALNGAEEARVKIAKLTAEAAKKHQDALVCVKIYQLQCIT